MQTNIRMQRQQLICLWFRYIPLFQHYGNHSYRWFNNILQVMAMRIAKTYDWLLALYLDYFL